MQLSQLSCQEKVVSEISAGAGKQFDPVLVIKLIDINEEKGIFKEDTETLQRSRSRILATILQYKAMANTNLDILFRQIDSFPSLPAIVSNVMEITGKPESSANELMQAILPDQSMCAAILKIANSAFFGLPREVSTIEKAVMVLGFDEIRNIVLGKAVFNSFKALNGNNKKNIEAFWDHSFTCGLAAKILAERLDMSPSEMFIAGLIHDIGKLALLITFPNLYSHLLKVSESERLQICEKEEELFYICHDDIARRILKRWLFPERLYRMVGYHHRPQQAYDARLQASIIQVADLIAHIHQSSQGMSAIDYHSVMLGFEINLFEIWQEHDLSCGSDEVKTWFRLLQESQVNDNAILHVFSS